MRILLAGGGTLGSVTPLLAVHEELARRQPDAAFLFVGTHGGPEEGVVREASIPFLAIRAAKLDRFFTTRLLVSPFLFAWSLLEAVIVLLRFRPSVMLSAGGYVAVPLAFVARVFRIPSVLLQLDLVPGLANRLMSGGAAAICASVMDASEGLPHGKITVTGIPVRRVVRDALERKTELAAEAEARFALDPAAKTVLIMGGGTGAEQVNALVRETANGLADAANVIHVTGPGKNGATVAHPRYRHFPLLGVADMARVLAVADIVVSRAGMGSIAELVAAYAKTVLIPMPESHQEKNAAFFAARAGVPVLGKRTTAREFSGAILGYLRDPKSYPGSVEKMRALLPPTAAQQVAEIVLDVARGWKIGAS